LNRSGRKDNLGQLINSKVCNLGREKREEGTVEKAQFTKRTLLRLERP